MKAKYKKIVCVIGMIQLYLLHLLILWLTIKYHRKEIIHIWLACAFLSGVIFIVSYIRFRNKCYKEIEYCSDAEIRNLFAEYYNGGKTIFANWMLYWNANVISPFVIGYKRIYLILPKKKYDTDTLKMILDHEFYHIKFKDGLYKLFLIISQCLLWYQPFFYCIKNVAMMNIEIACDEAVIENKDDVWREKYARMLVDSISVNHDDKNSNWVSFFCDSKKIIKARISAILDKKCKNSYVAGFTLGILILETIAVPFIMKNIYYKLERSKMVRDKNEYYLNLEMPLMFNQEAIDDLISINPLLETNTIDNSWSVSSDEKNVFKEMLTKVINFYAEPGQEWSKDNNIEICNWVQVSKDENGMVYYCIIRKFCLMEKEAELNIDNLACQVAWRGDYYDAYYAFAFHIKRNDDGTVTLCSIADGNVYLDELKKKYFADVSSVPQLRILNGNQSDAKINEDKIQICNYITKEWLNVPITKDELFDRGDTKDGELYDFQDGSYEISRNKEIIVYGGGKFPIYAVFRDGSGEWCKVLVSDDIKTVRKYDVSFPEESLNGYLFISYDRVMSQEMLKIYATGNGGMSWNEIGTFNGQFGNEGNSLLKKAKFLSNQIGFVILGNEDSRGTIFYRTDDGGQNWSECVITKKNPIYTEAYIPFYIDNGVMELWVGESGYSENEGVKEYYHSYDSGITWEYQGTIFVG